MGMWHRVSRLSGGAWRRWLLGALGALALFALLWTLAVGWWLPRFLQPRIEAAASEALGAPLVVERIDIAPWRLEARVFGLRLGPADAAWLRLAELRANVSTESLWRRAPVIERLLLREPALSLERLEPGRFNVTPMLQALAQRPPAPADAEPARFAVHNIRVDGGSARFIDRVTGREQVVQSLQLGIPFVSNLPSQVRLDVEPMLDAQVNGSRLHLQGKTRPFAPGRPARIDIAWQDLDVPAWIEALAPLLPQALPVAVQQGRLDLALHLTFEQREAPAPPTLQVAGDVTLRHLKAAMSAQGVALAVPQVRLQGLDLQPLERRAALKELRVDGPQVDLALDTLLDRPAPVARAGPDRLVLDGGAVAPAASAPGRPPTGGPSAGWQWRLDMLELADGRVGLAHPAWAEPRTLAAVGLSVAGLDGRAEAPPATVRFGLTDGQTGRVQLEGRVQPASASGTLKATVADVQLAPWLLPWQARMPVRVQGGRADVEAQASFAGAAWSVDQGDLRLADLQMEPARVAAMPPPTAKTTARAGVRRSAPAPAAADRLQLADLRLRGLQARGGEPGTPLHVQAETLALQGLELRALRDQRGGLAWRSPANEAPAAEPASEPPSARQAPGVTWQLGELRCSACAVGFIDRAMQPTAQIGLQRSELTLRQLSSDPARPIDFDFGGQVQGGGRVQTAGTLRPQPLALQSRLRLDAVDLRMLQPYLEPRVNLSLVSAKAHAAGELRAEGNAREPLAALRWRGRLALSELRALDQINQAEFLRFKSLTLDGTDIDWRASRLAADFGQVALEDFFARVIIDADGRVNLRDIVKREGEASRRSLTTTSAEPAAEAAPSEPASAAASAAPASAPAVSPDDAPRLRWRGIRLARGAVDFTDNFIRPNYSARLTDIDGEVSALAWDDPKPADVRIAGKVDGSAPLEIAGTVHPLGPRLATDIAASARGVDITRLSAYSARYAGYGIEKGTLSFRVHYTLKDGQLRGENQLMLDQLTFGDKVDSPNALKLPLQLAVSLLKDRNGVIDLNLPISGSLDDPQFSLGGLIVRVVVNLVTKAITAPFSLLASAFGGGQQELGHVEFAPGSAELDEPARAKLDTLVKALQDRPALKLEATGHADTAADEAALRQRHVERLMRMAKARARGELVESVTIGPDERELWLEAAYKDSDLQTKPRNVIGFAKRLPPAEMDTLLQQSAPVGSAALIELANRRGDRVKAYLVEKVSPERVLLSASKLDGGGKDPDEGRRVVFALR